MKSAAPPVNMKRIRADAAPLLLSALLAMIWPTMVVAGLDVPLFAATVFAGAAVFGAAYLLTWAAELAQFDIPRALAIVFVALVAVLPEYAVDMYYAWAAGRDSAYAQYAAANMTGSNRLLIGLGWVAVLAAFHLRSRKSFFIISVKRRVEMLPLLGATAYSFVIAVKGSLGMIDAVVLLCIFAGYIRGVLRQGVEDPLLEEGAAAVVRLLGVWQRRLAAIALFALAGIAILLAARPFAEGLLALGAAHGIDRFLLVQWVAPLVSESPEFIVAIVFALRMKPEMGLAALLSSKVNQWTLLVGMLPIAYALSSGAIAAMPLDGRQVAEICLTGAQSLFALIVIMDLRFSWKGAALLFILFVTQLMIPNTAVRYAHAFAYLVFSAALLIRSKMLRSGLRQTLRMMWKRPAALT